MRRPEWRRGRQRHNDALAAAVLLHVSWRTMSNVVLINPPMRLDQIYGEYAPWGSVAPPTGLCTIAGVLRAHGHGVAIVDGCADLLTIAQVVDATIARRPEVIGVTCKTLWMPTVGPLCAALKRALPEVKVVAGGNHVTALPERTLREIPSIDALVNGEGETTFLELVDAVANGTSLADVPGLWIRREPSCSRTGSRERIGDLDALPMPAFDLLPDLATHYWPPLTSTKRLPAFSVMTSRGCFYRCTFCDRGVFGNDVRYHSAGYCMALVREIHRLGRTRYIYFEDDNFLLNPELESFLRQLRESRLGIEFSCQSRIESVDPDLLRNLRASGCRQIFYGVETGSQRLLNAMRKGIRAADVPGVVAQTRAAKIESMALILLGYPGETMESLENTRRLIEECKFDDVGLFYFAPLPGSEIYASVRELGEFREVWSEFGGFDRPVFVPNGLTEQALKDAYQRCYNACYYRADQILNPFKRFPSWAHLAAWLRYMTSQARKTRLRSAAPESR